jgi:hypothetical protein
MSIDQVINAAPIPPLPGQLGLDGIVHTRGRCTFGIPTGRCGATARFYPEGWRCPDHTQYARNASAETTESESAS